MYGKELCKVTKNSRLTGPKLVNSCFFSEMKRLERCARITEMIRTEQWTKGDADGARRTGGKSLEGACFFARTRILPAGRKTQKNSKKLRKNFKKGLAQFEELEYNVEDVCKGDEVADCSLAGEVTVMDHVRESDDGSRPLCRAKKPSSRT